MPLRDLERERVRQRRLESERADAMAEARRSAVRNVGLGFLAVVAGAAVVVALLAVGVAMGIIAGLLLVLVAAGTLAGRKPNREGEQAAETREARYWAGGGH